MRYSSPIPASPGEIQQIATDIILAKEKEKALSIEQLQQIGEAIDVFFIKARRGERSLASFRRLLRANERKLSPAVREWMKLMVGQLQKGLAQVKGRKARLTAERLCDWKYVREQGELILKPALLQVLAAGGNAVVGRKIVKQERFDPIGVEAVGWATEHSAELVTEVATESKKAIRTFIADGVNAGKSIPKIASELRPVVGLADRYAGAVGKFATELYTSPKYRALSDAQRISKIDRYAGKLHRVRTEMIARTETRNALWEGTFQGYGQMGITRVEGVSGPGACDWCIDNIDGKTYTIKEARGIAEASHPSCACCWVAAKGVPEERRRIDFHGNITDGEMKAIKSYTWFDDYEHHRKYLTGSSLERATLKRELGAKEYKRISTEAEKLNRLFVKYKDGAQNQIIHRGLAVKDWQYEFVKSKYKPGDIAKVGDGISSWSSSIKVANRFSKGKHGVVFHLEKGRNFVDELDIGNFSRMVHEKEVLVKTEEFKIIKMTEKKIGENLRLDIYLEEIKKP